MLGQTDKKILSGKLQRTLRHSMTDAENALWHSICQGQIDGVEFRRQHPFGEYILDFVSLDIKLVIEVDGGQHGERSEYDTVRTHQLETAGFHVLRFWNSEVLQDIEAVKRKIWMMVEEIQERTYSRRKQQPYPHRKQQPHPHPNLPHEWEGKGLANSSLAGEGTDLTKASHEGEGKNKAKIVAVDCYHFCIPFVVPIRVGKRVLDRREGYIVALTDSNGRVGYGEVAPLPGLDETSLDRCRHDLVAFKERLMGAMLHYDRFQATAPWLGIAAITMEGLSPWKTHTRFGMECALMGLFLQQNGVDLTQNAASRFSYPLHVPVNGLFMPEETEGAARRIAALKSTNVKTVKVKISRMAVDEELRQILELAGQLGSGVTFRLDGNRSLTPDLYRCYYEVLRHLPVEYVEEPLCGGDLASARSIPWPIALDESLEGLLDPGDPRPSCLSPAVCVIILKPGLLNGLHAMARCAVDAERAGIKTVFSSAYNTGVTIAALGVFSRLAGLLPETAHGLDTLRYLAADVLTDSPVIHEGRLVITGSLVSGDRPLNNAVLCREDGL